MPLDNKGHFCFVMLSFNNYYANLLSIEISKYLGGADNAS